MSRVDGTAYLVFDCESVVDGALLSRVQYPGEGLDAEAAVARYKEDAGDENVFIPVTFHVPVAVAVARVSPDYRLLDLVALDAPDFDPRRIVETFWKGVEVYSRAALVDFNGRGFDIPLMTLSAFRFGIDCPRYFNDSRFGFRYRFTEKHIDLMEWLSEYGSFRMKGGLNLLAKMLGKPGKMGTKGDQVAEMFARGEIREINDYCLHDVLDTYFVLLRTRVLTGELSLEREQEIVRETKAWIADRVPATPALQTYLDAFGDWSPVPFV